MNWYYEHNGEQAGPISTNDMQSMYARGELKPDTLVWTEGFANWVPLSETELAQTNPSPPSTAPGNAPEENLTQTIDVPAPPGMVQCAESGEFFDHSEMVQVGEVWIGLPYRDQYLQKLREGGSTNTLAEGGLGNTPNSELAQKAKETLKGHFGAAIGTSVLYFVITNFASCLALFFIGPMLLGLYFFFMNVARRQSPMVSNLFDGFKQYGQSMGTCYLMFALILLWYCVLIIPGIIATYAYMMAFFIIADHPNMPAMEALRKSQQMMKGSKWKYFCLGFRYFWWYGLLYIIATVALGISTAAGSGEFASMVLFYVIIYGAYIPMVLYTFPLFYTASAHFYDDVRGKAAL